MEILKELSDAKTAFERLALRLADDARQMEEALKLLNRALAECHRTGRDLKR